MPDTLRVLHVDDDADFGDLTAAFLERDDGDFDVDTATSAREGFERLRTGDAAFDCVVSDYDMPGTDGLAFLESVREEFPTLPFILYTGKGSEDLAGDAIAKGATDYLQKRGGAEQYELLANRIRNAVDQYRTKRERERTIERVTDAILKVDADWQVTFADDRARELYDETYDRDVAEFHGRDLWELYPSIAGTRFEEEYRRVMETREATAFEAESAPADRWFDVEVYPDDSGGISIYSRDVTERRDRERELRRLKQEYQSIFENASDSLFLVDVEGEADDRTYRFRHINPANEAAIGLSNEEVQGKTHAEVFDDELAHEFVANYERCLRKGEAISYEETLPMEDGPRVYETTLSPVEVEGEFTQIVGVAHDITERKGRERELEATRERMEFALDATDSVIYEVGLDSGEETRHGPFQRLYGVESDRLPTTEDFYEHGVHPDDRDRVEQRLERATDEPGAMLEFEYRTHPDHGDVRWLRSEAYVQAGPETDDRRLVGLSTDVTERTEREWEIAEERDRYATLFENLPNPVVYGVAEDDTPIVRSVNPAFEDVFGVDADEIEGEHLYEFIVASDRKAKAERVVQQLLSGEVVQTEVRRETDDGPRTFRLNVAMRNRDADSPEGYAIYTDITDRKEHERQLTSLHEATRDLVEAETPLEVAEIASDTATDILGHPMNSVHLYDEDDGGLAPVAVAAGTREVLEDVPVLDSGIAWEAFRRREPRVRSDVSEVDDRYNPETPMRSEMYLPLGEHGVIIISSTEVDAFDENEITLAKTLAANVQSALDRTERERELERERDRQSALFEAVPQPVVLVEFEDDDPIVKRVNGSFEDVFGYPASEAEGAAIDDLIVPDRYLDEARALNRRGQETASLKREVRRETADGERNFLLSTRNLRRERRTESLGIFTDITEQKRREEELQRQNERLDEFASLVSHDLKNPLNTVELSLELAAETGDAEHFERCHRTVERMGRLLDDLLRLARQGERVDEMEAVDVADVVESTWETLETGNGTLAVETDGAITADEGRLRQLLENLVRNAVEHGGEGVTVEVGDLDGGFYVADDGPGVPAGDREDVFESGYTTREDGTGFGLAIVADIAEAHGWSVDLTDSEAGGARFEVTGVDPAS